MVYGGAQMRQDWLDELDLEVPTTIDEWDSVLKATKEGKNLDYALTFTVGNINSPTYGSLFLSTYGVLYSFYVDPASNEIKYGPMQDGYKEALSLLARWYDEGLLDPDFASQDGTTYDAKIRAAKVTASSPDRIGLGRYTTTVVRKPRNHPGRRPADRQQGDNPMPARRTTLFPAPPQRRSRPVRTR